MRPATMITEVTLLWFPPARLRKVLLQRGLPQIAVKEASDGPPERALVPFAGHTDTGLKELAGLEKLETLSLWAKVTESGVKELQNRLPNVKIDSKFTRPAKH